MTERQADDRTVTDAMAEAAMREFSAQKGESFSAMWDQCDETLRQELLGEWRAIITCALSASPSGEGMTLPAGVVVEPDPLALEALEEFRRAMREEVIPAIEADRRARAQAIIESRATVLLNAATTERTLHNAWRKRAEECEAARTPSGGSREPDAWLLVDETGKTFGERPFLSEEGAAEEVRRWADRPVTLHVVPLYRGAAPSREPHGTFTRDNQAFLAAPQAPERT